ncbi:hypothetical protein C8T65DRAFT_817442, partial [Cerioporus squamosus]
MPRLEVCIRRLLQTRACTPPARMALPFSLDLSTSRRVSNRGARRVWTPSSDSLRGARGGGMMSSGTAPDPEIHFTSNPSSVVHQAFLASITGRAFEDVKFFAFSRRTLSAPGTVDRPLPLLANSALLCSATSHFDYTRNSEGAGHFVEGRAADLNAPYPSDRSSVTDVYDYTSDSDLEDEPPRAVDQCPAPDRVVEDSEGPPMSEVLATNNHLDVGTERAEARDSSVGSELTSTPEIGPRFAAVDSTEPSSSSRVPEGVAPIARPGRVVFLQDIAYRTFKAFIFYTYTREVEFAPLKSQHHAYDRGSEDTPPRCSPKSMYRLAEKYDIPELREKALSSIRSKLTPDNVLEEIFSRFTSVRPVIQAMELEYLQAHISDDAIQARLPMWMEAMEDGSLPKGAAGIVVSLITTGRSGYRCSGCYHTLQ